MFNVSHDTQKFSQHALPPSSASGEFVMPDDNTVVSVDKDGKPVSYFRDDIWDFNAFFNVAKDIKSKYQINFYPEKHQPELLIELKQRIYFLIWGAKGDLLHMEGNTFRKLSSCLNTAKLASIALRVFKDTSVSSFALLRNELVLSQLLYEQKRSAEGTIWSLLKSVSSLTQVNQYFPEKRHFWLGIPEGKGLTQFAKQFSSSDNGHNPTVIPVIYEQLMGRLVRDIDEVYSKLGDLRDVKAYAKKYQMTEWQAFHEFKTIEGSCFFTLSAFTGMRVSELTQIDSTSYKEVDLDGVTLCTLRSWTSKLEKLPREDVWACAPICKKALAILTELNDDYRSVKGDIHSSPRFSFDFGRHGESISSQHADVALNVSNIRVIFTNYSKHLDITYVPDEMDEVYRLLNPIISGRFSPVKSRADGSFYWHFSAHSLRRTFAHFVVGNGLVTLAALKHQFKHISLSMTAIYTSHAEVLTLLGIGNPANVKKLVENAEMESHKTYLRDMFDHPEAQSGGFMKAFEGNPKVLTDKQFEQLVKETRGANKSTGFGRCFAGFKCSMNHLFEPSSCVGRDCENLNINRDEALRWQERHKRIGYKIQQMKEMGFYNQNTLARELTDIRSAEKVMRDHNIEFERFNLGAL
ncbi:MAG TPA: site-specific integrase [Rheinheimera sp.]|uniref:site-specific integrase n=1 Tax=Rheinheimera sp. TaxID=1869214 RepID=UPI002B4605F8|nr:site-specific integrase [Rheinheimera sp.]HJS13816.1 site-specific integrase [Rheinheimera sp.]